MADSIQQPRRLWHRQLAQIQMQKLLVQKCQRLMSLLDAAQRVLLAFCDMFEIPLDVARAKIAGMTFAVKQADGGGT
jgi:hypothetical protein